MKTCPKCGNILVKRIAKQGINTGISFLGCLSFPVCSYTENIHNDLTDEKIHQKINEQFTDNHIFSIDDINKICADLNFHDIDDFSYWIAKNSIKYKDLSFHNYISVGSPYNETFNHLCAGINDFFNDKIDNLMKSKYQLIKNELNDWFAELERLSKIKEERIQNNLIKIETEHLEALKRKSKKATFDIFNAITRKDKKAVISLLNKGAILTETNSDNLTPLELANRIGDIEIIKLLEK